MARCTLCVGLISITMIMVACAGGAPTPLPPVIVATPTTKSVFGTLSAATPLPTTTPPPTTVLPTLAPTKTPAPTPTVRPVGDLIAYIGSDDNVWLVRSDGTERRQVTTDAYNPVPTPPPSLGSKSPTSTPASAQPRKRIKYLSPKWSPLGDSLAFIRQEEEPVVNALMMFDLGTSALTTIRTDTGGGYDWSPDGQRIVFDKPAVGGSTPNQWAKYDGLWVIDLTSGKTDLLVHPQSKQPLLNPAWSPDGRYIATEDVIPFAEFPIPDQAIADLSIGGAYITLKRGGTLECGWSSDGTQLACVDIPNSLGPTVGPCPVTILKPNGDLIRRLTTKNNSCDTRPRWSPDDQWLAVEALVGELGQKSYVDILRTDGSSRERLHEGIPLAWSPDGERIVALDRPLSPFVGDPAPKIIVVDRRSKEVKNLAQGFNATWQP